MMLNRKLVDSRAVLAALLLAGCSASVSTGSGPDTSDDVTKASLVQMNDVSILYPLAKSAADMKVYLTPSTPAVGGVLLPEAIYDDVLGKVKGVNAAPDYSTLRVVAMRLDPCFANIGPITDPGSCIHQMRLVFQPISGSGTKSSPATFGDAGFHALYQISEDDFNAAVKAVVALRVANGVKTDQGALAVNPIMAKQGLTGAYAKGLSAIIVKYAGQSKLMKVTGFLSVFAQHTSWNFAADDVADSKGTTAVLAGLDGNQTEESVELGTADTGLIELIFPPTNTGDDLSLLVTNNVEAATADQRQSALDAALRIENPNFNSPNTIDCASCHVAEIAHQLIAQDFYKLSTTGDAFQFEPDTKYVTQTDVKVTYPATQPEGLSANVHAFSYDGQTPMIIQRVINESAAIVAYLNGQPQVAPPDMAQAPKDEVAPDLAQAQPDLAQAPDLGSM